MLWLWLCVLAVLPLTPRPLAAEDSETPPSRRTQASSEDAGRRSGTIRVDVDLALVNVTVRDLTNRLVTGLRAEHFTLKEDGEEQDIVHFSAEDAPVSVGIVFDTSGSIGDKMQKCREAVAQFMRVSNPEDEFFLTQFNHETKVIVPFTRSQEQIRSHLMFTRASGRTALLDAIYLSLRTLEGASHQRKALLVFSDGGDNSSRYTEGELKRLVKESDVQIYALGIVEPMPARARTPEELAGPRLLSNIAEQTGGRLFLVRNVNDLPNIAATVGIELRNQYVLGYVPPRRDDPGKWRKIRVKVKDIPGMPLLQTYHRLGYYAPTVFSRVD